MAKYSEGFVSQRSKKDKGDYIVPLSYLNKKLIAEFLESEVFQIFCEENDNSFFREKSLEEIKAILIAKKIKEWKEEAPFIKHMDCWHHTGIYANKTTHYNMCQIAELLLGVEERITVVEEKKNKDNDEIFVVKRNIWGGTRAYPKVIGQEEFLTIKKGNWFYCLEWNEKKLKKIKVGANSNLDETKKSLEELSSEDVEKINKIKEKLAK